MECAPERPLTASASADMSLERSGLRREELGVDAPGPVGGRPEGLAEAVEKLPPDACRPKDMEGASDASGLPRASPLVAPPAPREAPLTTDVVPLVGGLASAVRRAAAFTTGSNGDGSIDVPPPGTSKRRRLATVPSSPCDTAAEEGVAGTPPAGGPGAAEVPGRLVGLSAMAGLREVPAPPPAAVERDGVLL